MINIVRKILIWICSILCIGSIGVIVKILVIDPMLADNINNEAKNIYHNNENLEPEDKFSELLDINSDIYGWISIENTRIDYPVVKTTHDTTDFYLTHNYKKEKSKYGTIFMDPDCDPVRGIKNTTLYGHHMSDGQMFADLLKYSDLEFYKTHPVIKFDTRLSNGNWKVISVFKTNTREEHGELFNYTRTDFESITDFMDFVNEIKKRSLINTNIDVNADDVLLTLSTCSYEFKDFRTVVVARKVRNLESPDVDVNSATKATNPLMPACYYK